MSAIEKLEKYIEAEGITQISGGIFKDFTNPHGSKIKANTTVAKYCKAMGSITAATSMGYHRNEEPVSAEEYAAELLAFMTAPSKTIIGECRKCFKFLVEFEDENHEEFCNGLGAK